MKYAIVNTNNNVNAFINALNKDMANLILKKLVELEEIVDDAFILPYNIAKEEYKINEKECFVYSIEHSYRLNVDSVESLKRSVFHKIVKYLDFNEYGELICVLDNHKRVAMCGDMYIDYNSDIIYESVDIIKCKAHYTYHIYTYGLMRI